MESIQDRLAVLKDIKSRHEEALLRKANVLSVGIGMRMQDNRPVDGPGIVVNVTRKVPLEQLSPADRIPERIDGVPIWVQGIGALGAQSEREEDK